VVSGPCAGRRDHGLRRARRPHPHRARTGRASSTTSGTACATPTP
jgi:hypothetical protein